MRVMKHSRQREYIKTILSKRKDHPTADALYLSVREQFPNISLGTVYRNLNLLVELGEVTRLAVGGSADHFDGTTAPHYHFVCRQCRRVLDLSLPPMDEINALAQNCCDGKVETHNTIFYGICPHCIPETDS